MDKQSITHNNQTDNYKVKTINLLDDIEEIFLAFASRLGPYLAPVGPAYFVGRSVFNHLQANLIVAIIMAIALEFLGVTTTKTTLRCWLWNNQTKRKTDPLAPYGPMLGLTLTSYLIGIGLAVGLEVAPTLAIYAPGLFFILAGIGYFTLATTLNLTAWEKDGIAESAAKKAIQILKQQIKTLTTQLTKRQKQLTSLNGQLTQRQSQIDHTKKELTNLDGQLTQRQSQLTTLNSKIDHTQKELTTLNGQLTQRQKQPATNHQPTTSQPPKEKIATRQQKVLALIQKNLTNSQIANQLGVSLSTVKSDKLSLKQNGNSNGTSH